ncbi:MAG: VOC family protein [Methanomassiliicoccus sp.]|nr:VOC family protein [Methanomassiliicoccus sp.]
MKLISVRLMVDRFNECFRFYQDDLGLKVKWGELDGDYASFSLDGEGYLSIFRRELMARDVRTGHLPADAVAQDRSAVILQVGDVDTVCRRVAERGVRFVNPPTDYPDYRTGARKPTISIVDELRRSGTFGQPS